MAGEKTPQGYYEEILGEKGHQLNCMITVERVQKRLTETLKAAHWKQTFR